MADSETGRWPRNEYDRGGDGELRAPCRLVLNLTSLDEVKRFRDEELRAGRISVPTRRHVETRQQVDLTVTLPTCRRMLRARAVVERIGVAPRTPTGRVLTLRLVSRRALLEERLTRFLEQCPHKPCFRQGTARYDGVRCDVAGPRRDRPRRATPALGRPAVLGRLAVTKARPEEARATTQRATPLPGPVTTRRDRAGQLVGAAVEALDRGDRLEAISLLRVAVAYDHRNLKARALLSYLQNS